MTPVRFLLPIATLPLGLVLAGCPAHTQQTCPAVAKPACAPAKAGAAPAGATVAAAQAFVVQVERELLKLWIAAERASWVKSTFITDDTAALEAQAQEVVMEYLGRRAAEAVRFEKLALPDELRRKLKLLRLSLTLPAPLDAARRTELANIATQLESSYGKGRYCSKTLAAKWRPKGGTGDCLTLNDLEVVLAKSRNHDELLEAWKGWHGLAASMRPAFTRYVELGNQGAKELGFDNLGDLWKSRYDMTPQAFEAEVDRLWSQVKPLYDDLHCYARGKLRAFYGASKVPAEGPLPAHLLGNMWAQDWGNLKGMLLPKRGGGIDLEAALLRKKVDERGLVRYGESFFVSLGLDKLPETFWQRSMFSRPRDRDVVCHASAWDLDYEKDLRIKMCIKINDEDFSTVHHELGHNYYQYYYRHLAPLFRNSANDGFHEGLGDTIALSVTPAYLKRLGLADKPPADELTPLMERALEKIAFLPFGILVDKWRWEVFSGRVAPASYNRRWWELRARYQGVAPTAERGEGEFDPGAKFHIAGGVPYARYFLAAILQFQFHRALCKVAGHEGPLHRCSIYGNKPAGERLRKMMELGLSRPWPDALKALTGEERMDASAILAYFKPLHDWLREQNKGKKCGY